MTSHHVAGALHGPEGERLAARYGTPLYVYDLAAVELQFRRLRRAFVYEPTDFHYAIVCNKNLAIVRRLFELGCGIHANTPGDAYAALQAHVPSDRIVYSGTNLSEEDLSFLLEAGIRLNLDSLDQVRTLVARSRATDFGLRFLIDELDRPNRIGISPQELGEALATASRNDCRVVGLHMYAGTNTRRAGRFLECLDLLLAAVDDLPDLAYVDIGGGFGISYMAAQGELELELLAYQIGRRMQMLSERRGQAITLLVEPGRILVGAAGTLLTRVVSVKQRGGHRFVGVDTTVGNIAVPSVYHPEHRIELLSREGDTLDLPTHVCGNTTHSRDYLGRNLRLPRIEVGDLLALCDVGAYGYATSSHFLNRPRPAEVILDRGRDYLATRRETLADLLSHQVAVSAP